MSRWRLLLAIFFRQRWRSRSRARSRRARPRGGRRPAALPDRASSRGFPGDRDAINSPDRPAGDKELDASRHPAQILAFFGIAPGMKVADLWAGGGYTTELLARTVGPSGKVYSQNGTFPPASKKGEEAWKARLKEPGMSNVVELQKPFDHPDDILPVPPESLDAVIIDMNYHDLVGRGYDRTKDQRGRVQGAQTGRRLRRDRQQRSARLGRTRRQHAASYRRGVRD